MKVLLSRNLFELALSHCFDATERKAADSFCQMSFANGELKLTTKGSFTIYEESIKTIKCDADCDVTIKTATILEFVKYINSDDIILVYDNIKHTCLVSSGDKKSKLAVPQVDLKFEEIKQEMNDCDIFQITNSVELVTKLNFASKFCSNNFQDHPLTNIHCEVKPDEIELKSANGPGFYNSTIKVTGSNTSEFYLPRKTPSILKNIFDSEALEQISIDKNSIVFSSINNRLQVFIERTKDSFPDQILEWLKDDKTEEAKAKVSIYELSKALKFFNGIFSQSSIQCKIDNGDIELSCADDENKIAAKETVPTESSSGQTKSSYTSKLFLDCLESLQSAWVELSFITMQPDFALCKMSSNDTLVLLCPAIS